MAFESKMDSVPTDRPRRSLRIAAALALAIAGSLTLGYLFGRYGIQALEQRPSSTWVDREIRPTGTENIATLRCTYHLPDGTTRVSESIISLSTTAPFNPFSSTPSSRVAPTPECPPAP